MATGTALRPTACGSGWSVADGPQGDTWSAFLTERNRLFLEMTRQMEVDGAWSMHVSRERNQMIRPWVKGYKKHPILHGEWLYMDLDPRR